MSQPTLLPVLCAELTNSYHYFDGRNLSREVRSLPNIEYFAPDRADHARQWGDKGTGPCMPSASWEQLSEHGKHICREIVAPKGQVVLGAGFISAIEEEKAAYIKAQKEQLLATGKL